jgi:DNA-binding NarL/FixJ family response regulator
MNKIKLILIEDNRLLREGIAMSLEKESEIKVIASFENCNNILMEIEKLKPDVLLIDPGYSCEDMFALAISIKEKFSAIRMILMNLDSSRTDIINFIQSGVTGFILKSASVNEISKTIKSVAKGETIMPPNMTGSLFSQIIEQSSNGNSSRNGTENHLPINNKSIKSIQLTKREQEIVHLIAEGLSNKEIGLKLHLSHFTIKSYVHNLLEKLSLKSRVQIAIYARTGQGFKDLADTISLMDN